MTLWWRWLQLLAATVALVAGLLGYGWLVIVGLGVAVLAVVRTTWIAQHDDDPERHARRTRRSPKGIMWWPVAALAAVGWLVADTVNHFRSGRRHGPA